MDQRIDTPPFILAAGVSAFGTHGYGHQWWHTCYRTGWGTFETHTAIGNGQQRIYIVPALDLVVTILAGATTILRLSGFRIGS